MQKLQRNEMKVFKIQAYNFMYYYHIVLIPLGSRQNLHCNRSRKKVLRTLNTYYSNYMKLRCILIYHPKFCEFILIV